MSDKESLSSFYFFLPLRKYNPTILIEAKLYDPRFILESRWKELKWLNCQSLHVKRLAGEHAMEVLFVVLWPLST